MENPIRSIREISHDLTGKALVRLANGRQLTALEIQREYLAKVTEFVGSNGAHNAHVPLILDLWERTLDAIESGNTGAIDTEVDWAIKKKLMDSYMERHGLGLDSPRIAQLDLTYHDISRQRGLFYLLQSRGASWQKRTSRTPWTCPRRAPVQSCGETSCGGHRNWAATTPWTGCT